MNKSGIIAVLKNVTVAFDGYQVRALHDVSFVVRRGEVLGVLGGGHSGKSTALRLLAGRLRPTEGRVRVFGRSPARSGVRARIGFLAGRPAAGSERGGWKWFSLLSAMMPRSAPPSRETGGSSDLRRAQLRQAVLGNRELIVLDDAFEGLDAAGREEIKDLISELAARGKTLVLGATSLADARDVCDRLCILHEGRLQAMGTLDELLDQPEAIRILAPVLPPAVVQRLRSAIRQELALEGDPSAHGSSLAVEALSEAGTVSSSTGAGAVPSETASTASDVNHERLEALTKSTGEDSRTQGKGRKS